VCILYLSCSCCCCWMKSTIIIIVIMCMFHCSQLSTGLAVVCCCSFDFGTMCLLHHGLRDTVFMVQCLYGTLCLWYHVSTLVTRHPNVFSCLLDMLTCKQTNWLRAFSIFTKNYLMGCCKSPSFDFVVYWRKNLFVSSMHNMLMIQSAYCGLHLLQY